MQIITHRIQYKTGETFQLRPLFDVHLGNKACDVKATKKYLKEGGNNTLYIVGGDLFDAVIIGDKRYSKAIDDTEGEGILNEQVERGIALLELVKNRLIGIGMGNHEEAVLKRCGFNMGQALADRLDVPYLGYSGLVRLYFYQTDKRGSRSQVRKCIIRWHHGWGGGTRTQGGSITKYSKDTAYWDADLFLYGHDHRLQTDDVPRMVAVGDKLVANPKRICLCGSYLKTYIIGKTTTYSERAGYPPISIGGMTINLTPHTSRGIVRIAPQLGG